MEILFSYNLKGEKQWQTSLGKEWMRSFPGSRSAPTVVGDLLYVGTGLGNLFCINRANGKIVWSKDLSADFNGVLPLHGHSDRIKEGTLQNFSHPVIYKSVLYQRHGNVLMAFDIHK